MDSKKGHVLATGTVVTCLGRVTLETGVERVCVRQAGEYNYSITGWVSAKMLGPERRVKEEREAPEKVTFGLSGDSFDLLRGVTNEGVGFVRGSLGADYVDLEEQAAVLCVHTGGLNSGVWYGLFQSLDYRWKKSKVRFEVVAVELTGHGNSRTLGGSGYDGPRYDLAERAPRDVFSVLDDPSFPIVARPVYGFGHGVGATALVLSELAPGAFHGFGLWEPLIFARDNGPATAAFAYSRWKPCFEELEEKLEEYEDRDIARVDLLRDLATNKDDDKVYFSIPSRAWDGSTAFRMKCYATEKRHDEVGMEYEVLTCPPDVEESLYRSLPGAAHECHDRLGELQCCVAVAVAADGATLCDDAALEGKAAAANSRAKLFNYTDFTHIHEDLPEAPAPDPNFPPCAVCGTTSKHGGSGTLSFVPKILRCSRCQGVVYCSTQCQRNDWPKHRKECKPKPKKAPAQ
ncbi:hypothetical protein JL720_10618 [Aureococcus anophagefferens]|nr:hypothetical protein JL720_10618 [Aureococcus anophagefferens]